jgi:DNA (cytosine-5)-methyltransferase 1
MKKITHKFPYKWTLKNANFTKDKGKVFSCFACGGGSTMGYKLAGFDVIGCNEIDPKMMKAYRANHNPKYSFLEPIQDFKNRDNLPAELYELEILDGSPPCSSFSMAGNREKDWGKEKKFREGQAEQVLDTLFFDFIDLAEKLKPKVVVAENVKGLLLGNAKSYVIEIYKAFERAGYIVQHWLLDASKMGVPQRRERVFFIALRKDLAPPFMVRKDLFTMVPGLTLEFNETRIKFGKIRTPNGIDKSGTDRGELIKLAIPSDKNISSINERVNNKVSGFNAAICHDNEVRPTIPSGETDWRFFDKKACSDLDYIRAGTFPEDYNFFKTSESCVKYMVGMSVPPVMTAQIASEIFKQWLSKIN